MLERLSSTDLSSCLMEIAQNPSLRRDLDQILGDFCHQCRNRLNSLKLSIYLAKRQALGPIHEAWRSLESDYYSLEAQLDRFQTICRPMGLSLVSIGLCLLFDDRWESWSKLLANRGSELEFVRPKLRSIARFDVNKLGAALDSMVAWRAEQGTLSRKMIVRWWVESGQAHILWIEPKVAEQVIRSPDDQLGSAWTLPILTRVLTEHGGSLSVDDREGWALSLSWPASSS